MKVAIIGATCMNESISTMIACEQLKNRGIEIVDLGLTEKQKKQFEPIETHKFTLIERCEYTPVIEKHQHFYSKFDYRKKGKHRK